MNNPASPLSFITQTVFSVTAVLASTALHAQVAPDAGQISRELQKRPELFVPKAVAPLRLEGVTVPEGATNGAIRFAVKSIRVTGSKVFGAAELEALVADLSGGERSLGELSEGAKRITRYYRDRGYPLARAYLPAQDIKDGAVVVSVLEGALDQQRLSNKSLLPDALASSYFGGIKPGDVLNAAQVERVLLLLADTPGVGGARAALQPGASVGTTDLLVELDTAQAYAANVELDNYGNRYSGAYRLGAAVALNNPLNLGDLLSVRAISSGRNMDYARLAYQLPVGVSGLKVGAAYSDTRYKLGGDFAALQTHGSASSSSVFASYPFIRNQTSNLSGTLSWEGKKLFDQTDTVANSSADKQVDLVTLGLAGNRQDALGGGGMTAFDVSLARGNLTMDASSLTNDAADTHGSFTKLGYSLQRQQRVADKYSLSLALSGQQSSKNLNSSEKFSLGGASGVRAYPQGEATGDQGMLVKLEARRSVNAQMQVALFYDAGSVDVNRNPFGTGANSRFISGAGVGLNGQLAKLQFDTSLAWRASGGNPVSDKVDHNPRFWFRLSLPL